MRPKLLIVDDDEDIRTQMKWALAESYEIILAEDRAHACDAAREHAPEVALLDLGLPPHPNEAVEGIQCLAEMLQIDPLTKIIVITGQAEKDNALKAIGDGAYDFLTKPVDTEELKIILKRAYHVSHLEREFHAMQRGVAGDGFEGMLGTSPEIQEVFSTIRKVATSDVPVLILGESGTGKEMAALAIHRQGNRRDQPFVPINCSAIPETLLESELFGHEKGAFTGAHVQRKGRIEAADGGTLFLDEIGELPPSLQVKLLRFLQEQQIERVGGRTPITVNTRFIAATNADLKLAMHENRFREDLYFRIAVVVLRLPPLRERTGDIQLLAQTFLKKYTADRKEGAIRFDGGAARAIGAYHWPGNVREMENKIKRAVIMAEGRHISAEDLDLGKRGGEHTGKTLKEAREAVERDLIRRALLRHKGKISRAAEELDVSRPTLYELMEKLEIKKE